MKTPLFLLALCAAVPASAGFSRLPVEPGALHFVQQKGQPSRPARPRIPQEEAIAILTHLADVDKVEAYSGPALGGDRESSPAIAFPHFHQRMFGMNEKGELVDMSVPQSIVRVMKIKTAAGKDALIIEEQFLKAVNGPQGRSIELETKLEAVVLYKDDGKLEDTIRIVRGEFDDDGGTPGSAKAFHFRNKVREILGMPQVAPPSRPGAPAPGRPIQPRRPDPNEREA